MSTTISAVTGNDSNSPVSLLSLDAGGPQGVSQLLILKDVMNKLSRDGSGDTQVPVKRPYQVFDMIGGAGTGGLIAILLVVLKMTAQEALDEFNNFVAKVFKDVARDPIKQTEKLTRTTHEILERYGIAKDTKLIAKNETAPVCKLVVPIMYKKHVGMPCILRNYTPRHEPPVDLTIAEAMLATCSTPPIFTSTTISNDFSTFEYISGDLGLSNPTREIIAEAHHAFGDEKTVACLLSVGCGHPGVNAVPSDSRVTSWTEFLDGVARDSEKMAQDIGTQMSRLTLYHRLSVNRGLEKDRQLGYTQPDLITAHTTIYLDDLEVVELVNRCVGAIEHGDGFITLEQLKHSGAEVSSPPLPPLTHNYVERKLPMGFIEKGLFQEAGKLKPGSKAIVVTGIGGCGKTQLVRKFIQTYEHLFTSRFFVDGSSPDTIRRDIVRHVRALGGRHSQKSFEQSMSFISQVQDGELLLIIDNVDDPTLDLAPFIPRWQNGVIIVTSRDHSRGQFRPEGHLQLDVMTVDESVELLIRGSGKQWPPTDSEKKLAISMAETLGCHPIALVQAISYMYNTGCSSESYIALLCSNRDRMLRDHPAKSQVDMRYKTAFAAFDASYNVLPPKVQDFWHILSCFQWQNVPIELITLAGKEGFSTEKYPFLTRGEDFERAKKCLEKIFYTSNRWDPLELQSILATLRNHSLITLILAEKTQLLQMHPLVHEWGRIRVAEEVFRRFQAATVRLLCCGAIDNNHTMMQYLSVHVEAVSSAWETLHANDAASLGFILKQSGMCENYVKLNGIAHEMVKLELGPDHPATITTAYNLAVAYTHLGHYVEAEKLHSQVLQSRKQLLGVDHRDTISSSADLAAVYHVLGRYADAVELKTQVLQQRVKLLGLNHLDTIQSTYSLSTTYHALGRYDEAVELKTQVLRQREQILGADHPNTIRASAHLATTYHSSGRFIEAEELQTDVLQRRKRLLGVDHPDTIRASAHLATTYHALGRYIEAEELQTEVLRGRKQLLGADHPDTIRASADLATSYYLLKQYPEAEGMLIEVIKKRTTLLGEQHPETINSMLYLARTYKATLHQPKSSWWAQKARRLALETVGDGHPLHQDVTEFLVSLFNDQPIQIRLQNLFVLYFHLLLQSLAPNILFVLLLPFHLLPENTWNTATRKILDL